MIRFKLVTKKDGSKVLVKVRETPKRSSGGMNEHYEKLGVKIRSK
jgi:hypothetical protein